MTGSWTAASFTSPITGKCRARRCGPGAWTTRAGGGTPSSPTKTGRTSKCRAACRTIRTNSSSSGATPAGVEGILVPGRRDRPLHPRRPVRRDVLAARPGCGRAFPRVQDPGQRDAVGVRPQPDRTARICCTTGVTISHPNGPRAIRVRLPLEALTRGILCVALEDRAGRRLMAANIRENREPLAEIDGRRPSARNGSRRGACSIGVPARTRRPSSSKPWRCMTPISRGTRTASRH